MAPKTVAILLGGPFDGKAYYWIDTKQDFIYMPVTDEAFAFKAYDPTEEPDLTSYKVAIYRVIRMHLHPRSQPTKVRPFAFDGYV